MEDLDDIWVMKGIEGSECGVEEKAPATLKLRNMAGVFMLVAAGIVGGVGLIIIEIIYKKHAIKKQHRMDLARTSVEKWRSFVEVGSVSQQIVASLTIPNSQTIPKCNKLDEIFSVSSPHTMKAFLTNCVGLT